MRKNVKDAYAAAPGGAFYEGRDAFLRAALESVAGQFALDGASFYEFEEKSGLLRLRHRHACGVSFEHEEDLKPAPGSAVARALEALEPAVSKSAAGSFLFSPFRFDYCDPAGGRGVIPCFGLFRLERGPRRRGFSPAEAAKADAHLKSFLRDYYKAEFFSLNRKYDKNVAAITELTEVFATALRVRDSFRHILAGIQTYFGFDRVRLYLIDEKNRKLKGELSADIRGQIKSISYEEIPLEAGAHRFADIVLGRSSGAFMERYKDCVLYMPLSVQGVTIGLLIVDNLLSQQRIEPQELAMLKSFGGQIALAVDNARLFDKVEELSLYDELTKLPLRRYFNQRFQEEFYRAERFKQPLALIWADVDYFKEVNDTYGHQIGDKVLKEAGRVILSNLRKIDFPCRYGGDEIIILLPQATGEEARRLAQRLSQELAELRIPVPFSKARELRVTLSIGISTFPQDAATMDGLLEKADDALYWVKSHGRARIALYSEVAEERKKAETAGGIKDAPAS
ncbi:MAG: sensor domain-containing diguanylate cyclase [Elusimicrobiales bacterium]|nr:sensor domain-containing diguanylate cyclase [Elusimicrobiales bacterium]